MKKFKKIILIVYIIIFFNLLISKILLIINIFLLATNLYFASFTKLSQKSINKIALFELLLWGINAYIAVINNFDIWFTALNNLLWLLTSIKLIEVKAISSKAKIVNANMPEKIKSFISENFQKDLKYLEKKYKIKINLLGDKLFLVPEYEISFENKSKKILEKIENKIEIKKMVLEKKNKTNNVVKFVKKNFKKRKYFKRRKAK